MSKIKKIILLIIVLSACFTALFFGAILSSIAEYSFRNFCKECLSTIIKAENVKYGDRVVRFENIELVDKSDPNKIHLMSDEILLYFEPHFFKREIDFYVTLIDPKMDLSLIVPLISDFFKNKDKTFGLFKINHQVQIKNGILNFQKNGEPKELYISFDHDFIDAKKLNLKVSIDSPNDIENMIELKGQISEKNNFQVDVEFKNTCCQRMQNALVEILKDFDQVSILTGVLNGNLSIKFSGNENFDIISDLYANEITFDYKPLNISGAIPKSHLFFLDKNQGHLNLDEASFKLKENDLTILSLDQLTGQCLIKSMNNFKVDLIGKGNHQAGFFDLNLAFEKNKDAYLLGLDLDFEDRENILFNFRSKGNLADIKLKNFGPKELDVAQNVLKLSFPSFKTFEMAEGLFDAEFKLKINNGKLEKCKLAYLNSEHLKGTLPEFNLEVKADNITGCFDANLLSDQFLSDLSGKFMIDNGSLKFANFDEPLISEINTRLNIERGDIKPAILYGKFLGLEGKGRLDFSQNDHFIDLELKGDAENVIAFLPEAKREPFLQSFKEDGLELKGQFKKLVDAKTLQDIFVFEAESHIFSKIKGRNEVFSFGFEIEKLDSEEHKDKMLPKLTLQNGWFKADHLNLEKYIAPLIFQKNLVKMKGYADFHGSFDETKFHVAYNGQKISLENEFFVMETALIENGSHFFDLKKDEVFGTIPLERATCFDKNTGLLFTDIHGDFELTETKIKAPFIEAFSNGIYFSGHQEIDISCPSDGEFTVDLQMKTMKGKFSELQHFFSHFNKSAFFLKMPIEGDISLRQEGASLRFNFKPEECQFQASIQGEMSSGIIKSDNFDLSVQDLNVNFDYNHLANDLVFSDIAGTLLVGKPGRVEEYLVAGDRIHFTDYLRSESNFDVWVGDKNRDIIRVVGKTKAKDDGLVDIVLNHELSHFGDMHPTSFKCCLKDWSLLNTLNLDFEFKVDHLFKDLQRFSRTGFFFLSRSLLKELNELKTASGDFVFHLDYDQTKSLFNYQAKGIKIEVGPHKFDLASLKGTKSSQNWSLEELKLDRLTLNADITTEDNSCKINFLGVSVGSCLLAGLKGEYCKEDNALLTDVHLFEANLDQLKEFPYFKNLVDEFRPKGKFKGSGKLKVMLGKGALGLQSDLLLNGSLRDFEMIGLPFKDLDPFSCHYLSETTIAFEGIKTALILNKDKRETVDLQEVNLDAAKVHFEFAENALFVEGLKFKLLASNLKILTNLLADTFKKSFPEASLEVVNEVTKNGFLEGTLNLDISKPYYAMHLLLNDGHYQFFGKDHFIRNFSIDFDPCEFKLSTLYRYKQKEFFLDLISKSAKFDYGKLELKDNDDPSEKAEDRAPLVIYWRNHKDTGLAIEAAEGSFSGTSMQLYRNPEEPLQNGIFHLIGDVNFDMQRLAPFFPSLLSDKIRTWQIEKGYTLKGHWSFFDGKNYDPVNSKFKGELIGTDFEFKGYQFKKLNANVDYSKEEILINHLQLADPCGSLHAEKIIFSPSESKSWQCKLPLLNIEDFRPSLIRQPATELKEARKPLVITELMAENIEGDLFDEKSFKGRGQFTFKNPHKRNFQNTIFAIPAEIISRIGLSLTALTPVIGTIDYQILDGKILLNKFHDVFSEGRLSKFYLATAPYPSYVDFEGNLFMKVRMKHYNLLFKLAELFVVSIEGNLKKPTYSLHKQVKQELPEGLAAD